MALIGLINENEFYSDHYLAEIFVAELGEAAVGGEDRLTPVEYLVSVAGERRDGEPERFGTRPSDQLVRLDPSRYASADDYLFHQARLWFDELSAQDLPALNTRDPWRRADAAVRMGSGAFSGLGARGRAATAIRCASWGSARWTITSASRPRWHASRQSAKNQKSRGT